MSYMNYFYPESRFGDFTDIDGTILFYTRVTAIIKSSFTVLDAGCGRGAYGDDPVAAKRNLRILKGKVKRVIGIDVSYEFADNPYIDSFGLIHENRWPLKDKSVDLIICDSVIEHIEKPDIFFREANRVLKKGGYLCVRTANLWSYVALISKLVPNRLHSKIVKAAQKSNRKEEDVFPVFYKCNSIFKMRCMFNKYKFRSVVYGYEAEPSYLSFSVIAYFLGVLHQKIAPSFIRPAIFAFGQKM